MRRLLSPIELHSRYLEATVRFELTHCCLRNSRSTNWSYIAVERGRGVRPTRLFELHGPGSHGSARMSHAPITLVVGVGIEPTCRVFQTRANPSQLSDRCFENGARGETRTHEYRI